MICPNCGAICPDGGFTTERRPNGDTTCNGCNHKGSTTTFYPADKHDPYKDEIAVFGLDWIEPYKDNQEYRIPDYKMTRFEIDAKAYKFEIKRLREALMMIKTTPVAAQNVHSSNASIILLRTIADNALKGGQHELQNPDDEFALNQTRCGEDT